MKCTFGGYIAFKSSINKAYIYACTGIQHNQSSSPPARAEHH